MADFDLCWSFVRPNEDFDPPKYGIVPDPVPNVDPDAQAICGINSHYWPKDFARIAALPQSERGPAVSDFYRANFWNRWFQAMTSNRLAAMTLDASVNQGAGWAVKFLQGATGSVVDGGWGPNTLAAANSANVDQAVPQFIALRQARYRAVGGSALANWLARAAKVPTFT